MFLTRRQRDVLTFIEHFIRDQSYSPTIQEIARGVGLKSNATVHTHLKNLEQKKYLRRHWNRGRSIELALGATGDRMVRVPVMGRVAAGSPLKIVSADKAIGLPPELVRGPKTRVLRVIGDSMIGDQICHGDYIIIHPQKRIANGRAVVARILPDNTYTLKTYFREEDSIRLAPANDDMEPLVLPVARVDVQGVVIGVLRKFEAEKSS